MAKVSLAAHLRKLGNEARDPGQVGPFITISRQYGCGGFALGLLLLDILNEDLPPEKCWKLYHKDILHNLATETKMAHEMLEQQRHERPQVLLDLFSFISGDRVPSGSEIRNKISTIIRGLAIRGRAIIIGQGGAGATWDLHNGLSVRLEASLPWRIKSVAFREGCGEKQAIKKIEEMEKERKYLRGLYEKNQTMQPAFNLVYDSAAFTLAQVAQHVVYAMKLKKTI